MTNSALDVVIEMNQTSEEALNHIWNDAAIGTDATTMQPNQDLSIRSEKKAADIQWNQGREPAQLKQRRWPKVFAF